MHHTFFGGFIFLILALAGIRDSVASPTKEQTNNKTSKSQKFLQGLEVSIGDKDAPITIVMYYSLTCPHCYHFQKDDLPIIKEKFIDKKLVRFIYRDFPTDGPALNAAKLAWCKGPENKAAYLTIASKLLATQETWAPTELDKLKEAEQALSALATELGITPQEYKKCIAEDTDTEKSILHASFKLQKTQEVNTAPAFFLNGVLLKDKPTVRLIEDELAKPKKKDELAQKPITAG